MSAFGRIERRYRAKGYLNVDRFAKDVVKAAWFSNLNQRYSLERLYVDFSALHIDACRQILTALRGVVIRELAVDWIHDYDSYVRGMQLIRDMNIQTLKVHIFGLGANEILELGALARKSFEVSGIISPQQHILSAVATSATKLVLKLESFDRERLGNVYIDMIKSFPRLEELHVGIHHCVESECFERAVEFLPESLRVFTFECAENTDIDCIRMFRAMARRRLPITDFVFKCKKAGQFFIYELLRHVAKLPCVRRVIMKSIDQYRELFGVGFKPLPQSTSIEELQVTVMPPSGKRCLWSAYVDWAAALPNLKRCDIPIPSVTDDATDDVAPERSFPSLEELAVSGCTPYNVLVPRAMDLAAKLHLETLEIRAPYVWRLRPNSIKTRVSRLCLGTVGSIAGRHMSHALQAIAHPDDVSRIEIDIYSPRDNRINLAERDDFARYTCLSALTLRCVNEDLLHTYRHIVIEALPYLREIASDRENITFAASPRAACSSDFQ